MAPSLSDRVLGTDPVLRKTLQRTLLGSLIYLAINLWRIAGWLLGATPGDVLVYLFLYELCGVSVFLALQRTGWSKRFSDPAMTLAQILFALSSLTIAYALIDVSRGATLQITCVILAFGIYHLSPRQIFLSGLLAVSMLVVTLFLLNRFNPQHIDLGKQTLNIALATVVLPLLAYIGQQVSTMRRKQIKQGKDLAEALRRLEELAMRDALTGLLNRRSVLDLLNAELRRSQRSGQRFCVAMLDIDSFKRVNDTYGHQAGDAVLAGLAWDASFALRDTDVIARWGGEEFLLFLPCTTLEYAKAPLSRLSQRLASHDWAGILPADEIITASIGLAESEPHESVETLIARADKALYVAKSDGRNRIVVAQADAGERA